MTQNKLTALFKLFSRHYEVFRHFIYFEVGDSVHLYTVV